MAHGSWTRKLAFGWLVAFLIPVVLSGEERSLLDDVINDLETAKADARPITPAMRGDARKKLMDSATALDRRLNRMRQDWQTGWRKYLMWTDFQSAMGNDSPDLQFLGRLRNRLRRNHPGLENVYFLRFRAALDDYINLLALNRISDFPAYYESELTRLQEALRQHTENPTAETASRIGRSLGILNTARQLPELGPRIRSMFFQPNVVGWVSESFVNETFQTPVDDSTSVSEYILGTSQRGTAHTTGQVRFGFEPSADHAHVVARMIGTSHTRTVGSKKIGLGGMVLINSAGQTTIDASKLLIIDPTGITTAPARACTRTSTTICGICSPPLISGIVTSQVYKKKPQAEAVANQRAARRIERRFDSKVDGVLKEAADGPGDELRSTLRRLDSAPYRVSTSTTEEMLRFTIIQAGKFQITTGTAPPAPVEGADVGMAMHESAANNVLETLLAGKRFDNEQMLELIDSIAGKVTQEMKDDLSKESWSISFPARQPIVLGFQDSQMTITLRGDRFTRAEQSIPDPMFVRAVYVIEPFGEGTRLTRQGDIEVDYVAEGSRSARQVAFRSFARDRFNVLFKDVIETEGIELPEKVEADAKLTLNEVGIEGGWINLGWSNTPLTQTELAD